MDLLKKHRVDSSSMNMRKMVHKYIKYQMCVKLKYMYMDVYKCVCQLNILSHKALRPIPETRFWGVSIYNSDKVLNSELLRTHSGQFFSIYPVLLRFNSSFSKKILLHFLLSLCTTRLPKYWKSIKNIFFLMSRSTLSGIFFYI